MGVDLGDLFTPHQIRMDELSKKIIAIDAYNTIYQFLSIIRQRDGTPLMDSRGRITSHLSGVLYRTSNFMEYGIKPVYIFDGEPPIFKKETIEERARKREMAYERWMEAKERGEETFVYAQASAKVTDEIVEDVKHLLALMGVPYVMAPSEGEAQAAYMTIKGDAHYAASQDYDSLLFGAKKAIRNLAITGKRKLPRKKVYVEVKPEVIELEKELKRLEITREQLIDIAILVGTDYNEGIKGFGPKKAYNLIKKVRNLYKALEEIGCEVENVDEIREFFMHPPTTDDYALEWKIPEKDGIIDFLCGERDFSEERVDGAVEKMLMALEKDKQQTLDRWF